MSAIASSTSHTWFASIISVPSAPISSRMSARAPDVGGEVDADLHLEVPPAVGERLRARGRATFSSS